MVHNLNLFGISYVMVHNLNLFGISYVMVHNLNLFGMMSHIRKQRSQFKGKHYQSIQLHQCEQTS